jgi:hypothetical protein
MGGPFVNPDGRPVRPQCFDPPPRISDTPVVKDEEAAHNVRAALSLLITAASEARLRGLTVEFDESLYNIVGYPRDDVHRLVKIKRNL